MTKTFTLLFNSQNQAFHFLLFPRRSRTLVEFNISDFQCFPFPWSVINLSVLKMVYSDSLVTWDWGELLDSDNPVLELTGRVHQLVRSAWQSLPVNIEFVHPLACLMQQKSFRDRETLYHFVVCGLSRSLPPKKMPFLMKKHNNIAQEYFFPFKGMQT